MTYLPALLVAAFGVLLLLGLAIRMFVVLRRFQAVATTVMSDIRLESDTVQVRAAQIRERRTVVDGETVDTVDVATVVGELETSPR